MKDIRTNTDKLKTLLFGKDLRITEGDVYSEVREGDFSSYLPIDNYIYEQKETQNNVFDIRKFGARANDKRRFIPEYAKEYPESWRFRNLPAYALYARHVKNLELISFNCIPAKSTWKKDCIFEDVI